ncbi:outer membrane beta-barrel protein [Yoonia sp. BS5-3]|uniref:Outer membrane protein n=1 Tax=Yoonia phaeophyticola TaxID=3137369 RepID=A0ABZ2V6L4_9RHOB
MKRHLSTSILITIFANPVLAGGLSDPIIPPPPLPAPATVPFDWYVGLQAGPAAGDLIPELPDTAFPETSVEGAFYGLHGGVQRSFGAITAGVEIDYNTASSALEDEDNLVSAEIDTLAHLKIRAGGNLGSALIYGVAGLAYASGEIQPIGAPVEVADTAPFYGIGTDIMLSESISVGAEVLLHEFENVDDSAVDVEFTTAMLRVSYHF